MTSENSFLMQIRALEKKSKEAEKKGLGEKATENAVILPFIQALGYDIFDSDEVDPEFSADIGTKEGEKVDYALKKNGKPIIIIEIKSVKNKLNQKHQSQLFRYFTATDVDFAILTNGIQAWFYTHDADFKGKMAKEPFFKFDFQTSTESEIENLKKLFEYKFIIQKIEKTNIVDKVFETLPAPARGFHGDVLIPPDKSISHRAIMLSSISENSPRIFYLLESEDVMATKSAFECLGIKMKKEKRKKGSFIDDHLQVESVGLYGLEKPESILNMGNSGTSARLMMGILAGQAFDTVIDGDESLRKRPMKRVTEPLTQMGAKFEFLEKDGCLPIKVIGNPNLKPLKNYELPVASAQIKSAILLAALYADGETSIIEKKPSRNHTETMLQQFQINIKTKGNKLTIQGGQKLKELHRLSSIYVPRDPSSAAFFIAAALMVPKSNVTLDLIGINETRIGFLDVVQSLGFDVEIDDLDDIIGEQCANITACYKKISSKKKSHVITPEIAPRMIDEYPILAVLAASMEATVTMQGIGELRVKESDRIAAMEEGLKACGVKVESGDDWMTVHGTGKVKGGNTNPIKTHLDHRIAMSFIILGLIAEEPILLDDVSPINTSFPTFFDELAKLGVRYKF